jgi:hypothetical protein
MCLPFRDLSSGKPVSPGCLLDPSKRNRVRVPKHTSKQPPLRTSARRQTSLICHRRKKGLVIVYLVTKFLDSKLKGNGISFLSETKERAVSTNENLATDVVYFRGRDGISIVTQKVPQNLLKIRISGAIQLVPRQGRSQPSSRAAEL